MQTRRTIIKKSLGVGLGLVFLPKQLIGFEGEDDYVTLYDFYAMALYMDGSLGPKTGIIRVDYILAGKELKFTFWHGHGGKSHEFELLPEHYLALKQKRKVYLETTLVEGHKHRLFLDPMDPKWRVPGAEPVEVPLE